MDEETKRTLRETLKNPNCLTEEFLLTSVPKFVENEENDPWISCIVMLHAEKCLYHPLTIGRALELYEFLEWLLFPGGAT